MLTCTYTGHTQKNGAVLIVFTIETAPFFCVCPVYRYRLFGSDPMTKEKNGIYNEHDTVRDFRLAPRRKRDLPSSGMLRNADLYLVTDVSGQTNGPIFLKCLTPGDGTR